MAAAVLALFGVIALGTCVGVVAAVIITERIDTWRRARDVHRAAAERVAEDARQRRKP